MGFAHGDLENHMKRTETGQILDLGSERNLKNWQKEGRKEGRSKKERREGARKEGGRKEEFIKYY